MSRQIHTVGVLPKLTLRALGLLVILLPATATTAVAQITFDGCGTIVEGVECDLFAPDSGGLYVTGLGSFQVGDYVHVTGTIDPFCITFCQQGDGCIFGTIELCDPVVDVAFVRGDLNVDGGFDIADPILLLSVLFTPGTPGLACNAAADANGDDGIDIGDTVYMLGTLFTMGPPPAAPFPDCDTVTLAALDCDSFSACP